MPRTEKERAEALLIQAAQSTQHAGLPVASHVRSEGLVRVPEKDAGASSSPSAKKILRSTTAAVLRTKFST